ncbi:TfoX/Sxy family protein [Fulvimonas yonginensis]|uniref:TfoX/Sxy family protein n=1 Tax=Fulvimonas yonginensis TaxID=1495200 RepID=A0ABU8JD88_9GAMM
MATDRDFVDYVAEQIGLGSRLTHKRMFGEYALYVDEKVVAFICDNSLFVKPSPAAQKLEPDLPQRSPYPGAKLYPVADELLDDSEAVRRLIVETAALMPPPKPKRPRKTRPRGGRAPRTRLKGRWQISSVRSHPDGTWLPPDGLEFGAPSGARRMSPFERSAREALVPRLSFAGRGCLAADQASRLEVCATTFHAEPCLRSPCKAPRSHPSPTPA